tara:strand:- start:72 stop:3224 length:3153 start_codon:yes stop_codon:yes gene_type:complete
MKFYSLIKSLLFFFLYFNGSLSLAETEKEFDERFGKIFKKADEIIKNDLQAGITEWERVIADINSEFEENHEVSIAARVSLAGGIVFNYEEDLVDDSALKVAEENLNIVLQLLKDGRYSVREDLLWVSLFFTIRSDFLDEKSLVREKIEDAEFFFSFKPWEIANSEYVAHYISTLFYNMDHYSNPKEYLEFLNLVRQRFPEDIIKSVNLDIVDMTLLRVLGRELEAKNLRKEVSNAYLNGIEIEDLYLKRFISFSANTNDEDSLIQSVLNKYLNEASWEDVSEVIGFNTQKLPQATLNLLCDALVEGSLPSLLPFSTKLRETDPGVLWHESFSIEELSFLYICFEEDEGIAAMVDRAILNSLDPLSLEDVSYEDLVLAIMNDARFFTKFYTLEIRDHDFYLYRAWFVLGKIFELLNKMEQDSEYFLASNKVLAAGLSSIVVLVISEIMEDSFLVDAEVEEDKKSVIESGVGLIHFLDEFAQDLSDFEPFVLIQLHKLLIAKVQLGIDLGDRELFDRGRKGMDLVTDFISSEKFRNDPYRFYGNRDIERAVFNDITLQLWLWATEKVLKENDVEDLGKIAFHYFQNINHVKSSSLINTFKFSSLKRNSVSDVQSGLIKDFEKSIFEYRNFLLSQQSSIPGLNLNQSSSRKELIEKWEKISSLTPVVNEKDYNIFDYMFSLNDNEYLISFLGSPYGYWVTTIGNDFYDFHLASSKEMSFEDSIRSLRSEILNFEDEFNDIHSKYLYDRLLRQPLDLLNLVKEDSIDENTVIYLVPDLSLYSLPFGALKTEEGSWLNDKYILKVLATEQSIIEEERKERKENLRFVGFGDPKFPSQKLHNVDTNSYNQRGILDKSNFRNLIPLRETADELLEIKSHFESSEVFLQNEASETNVKLGALDDADLIVFSSHALLSGEIEGVNESGIVLSTPEIPSTQDDGFLTPSEIVQLNLDAPTVILSACNTAGPNQREGQTFSGLANAFLISGAKSVIVSHWKVESFSTKTLITESIEKSRKQNYPLSEGLVHTQREMSRGYFGKKFKHPYFWASFTSIGLN